MANIRIKDISTTAAYPAADDFLEIDGTTNGSRKLSSAYLTGRFAARAAVNLLACDGGTSGRGVWTLYGTLMAGGFGLTVRNRFVVPTSNPSSRVTLWAFTSSNSSDPAGVAWTCGAYLETNGDLVIQQNGATPATDYRKVTYSGWRAAYSGQFMDRIDAITVGSSAPTSYQWGVALTGGTATDGAGTDPDWAPASMATTYFAQFYNWPFGYVIPGSPILRTYAQSDVDFVQLTGSLPPADFLGANAAGTVTGDNSTFASDTGFWTKSGGTTISGGAANFAGGGSSLNRPGLLQPRGSSLVTFTRVGSGTSYISDGVLQIGTTRNASGTYAEVVTASSGTTLTFVGVGGTIDDVTVVPLGAGSIPTIQPGCPVLTDASANGIPSYTVGMTAIGPRPEVIAVPIPAMSADGFVHLDGIVTPVGYELFGGTIERTAGASTGTITIKATSSGGTTLATGTLGSTPTSLTLSNVYSGAGVKLHLANSSWSSSTLKGRLLFRRY